MHKKFGFTLIELLTVVMILGILTAFALPQYRKAIQRTTAANALINLKTIFDSAKRYKASHSTWPTAFNQLDVDLLDISTDGVMGEFQYTFDSNNGGMVSACRTANGAPSDTTFCLSAHYRRDNSRDVYLCEYKSDKFKYICESMGTCNNGVCVVQ